MFLYNLKLYLKYADYKYTYKNFIYKEDYELLMTNN